MIEVNITDTIVETKNPSTVNFVMLLIPCLRIARRIAPGMINKDGRTNITLISHDVFVRHEAK
jgi:hypothetical protein